MMRWNDDVDVALAVGLGVIVLHHLAQRLSPFCCSAKGSTMVLPPNAAERVPLAKSSAITMPGPEGWAMWTWLSMPPGSTSSPVASISARRAFDAVGDRDDLAVANADIGAKLVAGRHDGAAANGEIELCH